MGRIHRLLNYLRDETGTVNPTCYRLSGDGRSLLYDATLPPKTPLHFHIKHRIERDIRPVPCGYSISCPGMCLRDLSWLEVVYLHQQIVASPFITRCNIHSGSIQGFVPRITVTETPNPLIASTQYVPSGGKWGTRQDTIDLTPGSADFQLAVSLKKQVREEKNRPHRLRRRGIMAFLQTLGLDQPDADFSIGFLHHHIDEIGTKDGVFNIRVRDNHQIRASRLQPNSPEAFVMLYEGDDPAMFARAIADLHTHYPCASKFHQHSLDTHGCELTFTSSRVSIDDEMPPPGMLTQWLAEAAQPTRPKPAPKPDMASLLSVEGLVHTLNLLNCEPARFALEFEHNPKTGFYTITLLPAREWTIRVLPSIYLYNGTDRAVFVRAVAEFMESAYREKITSLYCGHSDLAGNTVHVKIRLRHKNYHITDIKAPLTGWLEEAARLPTASESDQR